MGFFIGGEREPLGARAYDAICASVAALSAADVLPHGIYRDIGRLRFLVDHGMNLKNGVLGAVSWHEPSVVRLSPIISRDLNGPWWSIERLSSISEAMGHVIHELTHTAQLRWMGGLAWPVLNIPGVNLLTLERWAVQNQMAATRFLWGMDGEDVVA